MPLETFVQQASDAPCVGRRAVDLTVGSVYVRADKSGKRSMLLPPFGVTRWSVTAAGYAGAGTTGLPEAFAYRPVGLSRTGLRRLVSGTNPGCDRRSGIPVMKEGK